MRDFKLDLCSVETAADMRFTLAFVFAEFLEARIIPKRIEHRIEPEQRGSKRHASSQCARVRYRE